MDQRIIDLYDAYTHGALARRDFLDRLGRLAGGSAAALALLGTLQNDYAHAQTVAEDDSRLAGEDVSFGPAATRGYLVRPRGSQKRPAVVVIHENRGLNPHIRDVARRVAVEGYLTLAPDLLSAAGGTPADEDKARELIAALDAADTRARLAAAVAFLAEHAESTGRVGAVGFCWGGGMVNTLAAAGTALAAGVAYYGRQLPAEEVPRITAPLLLQYAGQDERINAGIAAYEAALKQHAKPYELHVYEGAQHAFNNDTNPARYDAATAKLAWQRTLAFLARHLSETPAP
jgi:carboxymethylenebutenolidase